MTATRVGPGGQAHVPGESTTGIASGLQYLYWLVILSVGSNHYALRGVQTKRKVTAGQLRRNLEGKHGHGRAVIAATTCHADNNSWRARTRKVNVVSAFWGRISQGPSQRRSGWSSVAGSPHTSQFMFWRETGETGWAAATGKLQQCSRCIAATAYARGKIAASLGPNGKGEGEMVVFG